VPVINPSTGKRIFDLPQLSANDVHEAVLKARAFAPSWSATPAKERQAVLTRLHDLMLENESKLLDVLQLETGKSRAHAFEEFAGAAGAAAPGGTVWSSGNTGGMIYNTTSANSGHFVTGYCSANVASMTALLYDRLFSVAKTMNSTANENVTGVPTRYQSTTSTNATTSAPGHQVTGHRPRL
jgi:hypothetical protein